MTEKLREAAQQALEALKHSGAANMRFGMAAIVALEAALAETEPVQEPLTRQQAGLRRGDILRCAESGVLCTVWATSTSGKALVKWGPNDFGSYTAEQIGELFWVEPRVQETGQEPYCHVYEYDSVFGLHREFYPHEYNGRKPDRTVPLYTHPPQRPPLTDEEINDCLPLDAVRLPPGLKEFARRIERKVRGEKE